MSLTIFGAVFLLFNSIGSHVILTFLFFADMLDIHLLLFLLLLPFIYSHPCNFNSLLFTPECIFSEKNHLFWCVSAKTDKSVSCPTTNTTAGGNDPGKPCVFPFIHKGKKQFGCLPSKRPRDHGRRYCATTANYDRDGQWTFCYVATRNSVDFTLIAILQFVILCILLLVFCVLKIRLLHLKSLNILRYLKYYENLQSSDWETKGLNEEAHVNLALRQESLDPSESRKLLTPQSSSMTEDNSKSFSSQMSRSTIVTQLSSDAQADKEEKQDNSIQTVDSLILSGRSHTSYETQTSSTPLLNEEKSGESTV